MSSIQKQNDTVLETYKNNVMYYREDFNFKLLFKVKSQQLIELKRNTQTKIKKV